MLNHIVLMGRLVRDPELRRTASGISCVSFTLAVDRDFKPEGGEKETDFIDCVAWRSTADFVSKYFSKGRMAVASGRLQVRKWKNKDGENRYSTEVLADHVYFGDSKKESSGGDTYGGNYGPPHYDPPAYPTAPAQDYSANNFDMLEDDDSQLPF